MAVTYVLYNPYAGGWEDQKKVGALARTYEQAVLVNVCHISDYETFFNGLEPDAEVILCGGDGTLNRFANDIKDILIQSPIYYFPMGTGNDFARDLGYAKYAAPVFRIDPYLKRLPSVTVNGETHLFLNNVGFGIDGYCCETGDELRAQNKTHDKEKSINYTKIAINGLLFHFKPRNATITVDGQVYDYKKVWLAPVMNGRFYGGGMMAAPAQDRMNREGNVSLMVFHDVGKLRALMIFPSIFQGKHIQHTGQTTIHTGHDIHVRFDQPTPLQIDGETKRDVLEYTVVSPAPAEEVYASYKQEGERL